MENGLRGYKLCKQCGAPMLKKGQRRTHPDAYRHVQGCPADRSRTAPETRP
jgi:hypothetical protein